MREDKHRVVCGQVAKPPRTHCSFACSCVMSQGYWNYFSVKQLNIGKKEEYGICSLPSSFVSYYSNFIIWNIYSVPPGYEKLLGKPVSQDSISSESRSGRRSQHLMGDRPVLETRALVVSIILGTMEAARGCSPSQATRTPSSVDSPHGSSLSFLH